MPPESKTQDSVTTNHRHGKFIGLVALVAVVALALDLLTKWWALSNLEENVARPLIGTFIQLRLIFNPGAAFSLGEGSTWVFTIISILVVGLLIWFAPRVKDPILAVIVGLMLGGTLGNLWDRLSRPPAVGRGHVVDFIDYNGWFVGNVADIWIVVAALFLVLWVLVRSETGRQSEASANESSKSDD